MNAHNGNNRVIDDEFWSMVEASQERLEHIGGQVYMDGKPYTPSLNEVVRANAEQLEHSIGSYAHARVNVRLSALLEGALQGKPHTCLGNAFFIQVESSGQKLLPDNVVHSGDPRLGMNGLTLLNPAVVFEILSPESESYDRGEKFEVYSQISTLNDYLLISPDTIRVTHFVRQAQGWEQSTFIEMESVLSLSQIEVELSLRDLYDGMNVPQQFILFPSSETELMSKTLSLFETEAVLESPSPRVKSLGEANIWCDGACSGNPGRGGWGAIIEQNGKRRELSGGDTDTTNNKMELSALIAALKDVAPGTKVKIVTDSDYVVKGATVWVKGWIRNGWKTAAKAPVKNKELWQELHGLLQMRPHSLHWVKGHAGHPENERCDELARNAIEKLRKTPTSRAK
ncbi:ribonuclease HI [Abditibacteriota bacterium]|nr:ribonuclease HI [Abditibacteriota bacterium]